MPSSRYSIGLRCISWFFILPVLLLLAVAPVQAQTLTPEEEALHTELRALKDRKAAAGETPLRPNPFKIAVNGCKIKP